MASACCELLHELSRCDCGGRGALEVRHVARDDPVAAEGLCGGCHDRVLEVLERKTACAGHDRLPFPDNLEIPEDPVDGFICHITICVL